jgi:ABC-2 type transport system permease protein
VLDIPPRFEADVLRDRNPLLQLNIDATAMRQAAVGAGYIASIVQQETTNYLLSRGIDRELPLRSVARAFFNPNLEGVWYKAIDAILENVTMLTILLVGAAVIRERERGTIEHLLVMPVRAHEIAAPKIWANVLIVVVAGTLSLLIVVEQILKVPVEGSLALFVALLAIPVFLTLNMLSGGPSPLESMPESLQVVIQISPAMHFVKFAQSVLCRGAGLDVVWPHLAVLVGLGAAFLALALGRFRSMLAQSQ